MVLNASFNSVKTPEAPWHSVVTPRIEARIPAPG
jgi:hypothetical protein